MPPKIKTSVQETFARIAGEVDRLGDAAIARMYPALIQAEQELELALRGFMDGIDPDETFTRMVVRRQLAQLKSVRERYKQAAPGIARALEQAHGVARGMSLAHLKREMAAQLGKGEFASVINSQVNLFAADAAASQMSSVVPRHLNSVRRYPGQVWADLNKNIQVSILKGETVFDATNRMLGTKAFTAAVAKNGVGAELVKGHPGLGRRYRYWAERLVRTETMSAYNQVHADHIKGLHGELSEFGVNIMKRWDASLDLRLCKFCRDVHGVCIPVDAMFRVGRLICPGPPGHPNCRCVLVTFVPGLDKP